MWIAFTFLTFHCWKNRFRVITSLKGSLTGVYHSCRPLRKQPELHPISFFSKVVELGGDTKFQKFKPPPPKRQLFYNFVEPTSGLSTLHSFLHCFCFVFVFFWQQIHKKWKLQKASPWETEKTKTDLTTGRVSALTYTRAVETAVSGGGPSCCYCTTSCVDG